MKTVKDIEEAIKDLSREEFISLANKIAAHQAALWEEQDENGSTDSQEFLSEGVEETDEEFDHAEELEYAEI